ncbi:hypothetical protein NUU61_006501 [Penicillium alfredii]|uniref:Uncharacterized protein n=1 Tax=Penicillium alfredii TaxID=1506179 RepID=A0A9W9F183_9EURO|nr:uncharacterized protein NUU61_006501 [Penicillium alfredii]KAJ5091631.1 hypothetical protein NUU61_006501 [Penicillium alfredii]
MRRLQAAIDEDPEIDLKPRRPKLADDEDDIRESLDATTPAQVISPLSESVSKLLDKVAISMELQCRNELSARLCELLRTSETMWKGPFPRSRMIFRCSNNIIVKAIAKMNDHTEYTTLQCLEHHPSIPAPKPLGLVVMNRVTLAKFGIPWIRPKNPRLATNPNTILEELRSLPYSEGTPFGGQDADHDSRRFLKTSWAQVHTLGGGGGGVYFWTCFVSYPHQRWIQQPGLCSRTATSDRTILLWRLPITIIMWLRASWIGSTVGFYPQYYESSRCTNCLTPYGKDDWYLHLPDCVSPRHYAQWWLLDRVRELRVY